jgi:hypothetical protein
VDLLVGRIKRNGKHGVRGVRDEWERWSAEFFSEDRGHLGDHGRHACVVRLVVDD